MHINVGRCKHKWHRYMHVCMHVHIHTQRSRNKNQIVYWETFLFMQKNRLCSLDANIHLVWGTQEADVVSKRKETDLQMLSLWTTPESDSGCHFPSNCHWVPPVFWIKWEDHQTPRLSPCLWALLWPRPITPPLCVSAYLQGWPLSPCLTKAVWTSCLCKENGDKSIWAGNRTFI